MSKDFTRRMALKIFFQMDDIYEDIVRVGNNLDTLNIKREEIQDRNQPQLIQSSPMQPIPMPVSTPYSAPKYFYSLETTFFSDKNIFLIS